MKDEESFSRNEPHPIVSDDEHSGDRSALSPAQPMLQEVLPPAHAPKTQRQFPPRLLLLVIVVVLVALSGAYGVFRVLSPPSHQITSAFQQASCPFSVGAGLVEGQNVTCGFLTVPEDRSQPRSPTIRLAVAVFKTPNPHPAPDPLLVLGGGPGGAQLVNTGPLVTLKNLASFAPDHDIILLDQRGEGYSRPSLSCQANENLFVCHDRLVSEGINLDAYTTLENAADVHDLVRAFGYHQVNLEGRSYGTRLALTLMRLYPTDLRSVVLISVDPPQLNGFATQAAVTKHAFNIFFQGCVANAYCNARYPHLQTVFYQLVSDLNSKPITFQTANVEFTGNNLKFWLFNELYSTNLIPLLPGVIFQIRNQDYTQLSRLYSDLVFGNDTMSWGLYYSVECGEDMAYTTLQRLQASVQVLAPELRTGELASLERAYEVCQVWNEKAVPVSQKEPVTSSIPTLLMEGEYDPITPPANGMLAEQTLSRSFFFLFPGVTHGVHTANPCPSNIEHAFLDNPSVRPDASCISSMGEPIFT